MNVAEWSEVSWMISSRCSNKSCVEVGRMPDGSVAVRDTKDRGRPPHVYTSQEWADFVAGVKAGEFDLG